jgi:hypothetical protein
MDHAPERVTVLPEPSESDVLGLIGAGIEAGDLEQLLVWHFRSAAQDEPDRVRYPNWEDFAVELVYRDGEPIEIKGGPRLADTDIDDIRQRAREEFLESTGTIISRAVMFSSARPVRGWWRYRDLFQIVPPPASAPLPDVVMADWPFVLEFQVEASVNGHVTGLRRARRARELSLLLTTLLVSTVLGLRPSSEHHWVGTTTGAFTGGWSWWRAVKDRMRRVLRRSAPANWSVAWLQEFYMIPGLGDSSAFTDVQSLVPIEEMETQSYYRPVGLMPDESLHVPTNLSQRIDKFFALSETDQERYQRSAYWLEHAMRVFPQSQSDSYVSLIAAVEALVDEESGAPHCVKCGKSMGKGPTALFRDFLEMHAPDQAGGTKQGRNNLYRARSALTHGWKLLASDTRLSAGLDPRHTEDDNLFRSAWQAVRVALVHWLETTPGQSQSTSRK